MPENPWYDEPPLEDPFYSEPRPEDPLPPEVPDDDDEWDWDNLAHAAMEGVGLATGDPGAWTGFIGEAWEFATEESSILGSVVAGGLSFLEKLFFRKKKKKNVQWYSTWFPVITKCNVQIRGQDNKIYAREGIMIRTKGIVTNSLKKFNHFQNVISKDPDGTEWGFGAEFVFFPEYETWDVTAQTWKTRSGFKRLVNTFMGFGNWGNFLMWKTEKPGKNSPTSNGFVKIMSYYKANGQLVEYTRREPAYAFLAYNDLTWQKPFEDSHRLVWAFVTNKSKIGVYGDPDLNLLWYTIEKYHKEIGGYSGMGGSSMFDMYGFSGFDAMQLYKKYFSWVNPWDWIPQLGTGEPRDAELTQLVNSVFGIPSAWIPEYPVEENSGALQVIPKTVMKQVTFTPMALSLIVTYNKLTDKQKKAASEALKLAATKKKSKIRDMFPIKKKPGGGALLALLAIGVASQTL